MIIKLIFNLIGSQEAQLFGQTLVCVFLHDINMWIDSLSKAAAAAKSLQSCPTLCNPIDGSPSGSPVPGILQARTLEWVANAWKWKNKMKSLSRVWLLVTPWTAAYEAPPSMGFSRQEYWSGVPLPSPYVTWELTNQNQGQPWTAGMVRLMNTRQAKICHESNMIIVIY